MEYVVPYNAGKAARISGASRQVPDTLNYPLVSQYVPYSVEVLTFDKFMTDAWCDGFDGRYDRKR